MAQDLIEKIRAAAQAKGIDPEVALSIARAESNFDPNAKNKSSSASGLFQVINKTWAGNKGAPGKQFDPDENIRVGTDLISKNVQSLKGFLGRDPSPKEVYAAHYFGASGAQDFLSAAPDTPTSKIFSEKVLSANPNLKNKTAGEVLAQLERKMTPAGTANVSRETKQATKAPLPPSLPPMAEATQAKTTTVAKLDMTNMPASYKAAFALAALADAQDEEDDRVFNENKGTETEAFFANYKPVNHLASLDLSVAPINFAEGGDVSARQDEPFFDAASRTYVDVLTGRRTPITEKDFTAKEQLAMMDAVKKSLARGGKGRVDYQDYPTGDQIGPGFVDIRNTLGGFQYKQNPDGSTVITDRYDFHGPRAKEYEKMGMGEKLVKSAANALSAFVKSGGVRDAAGELGDAWIGKNGPQVNIRIPVNRAKGGDAEPTAEEIEAASTPAFIAQKSGIGRKAGNISKALKSGEGYVELAKGMTNVPQNILGAPMDISNMIANVYGGGVEKPFMGSDYIKEGLRSKGLGFTPSKDPTLAGFYEAGDLGSNFVNPAGATRAGVKAAGKTGEAAQMLAKDFQQYNQELAVPGASYAMKPKGGHYYVWPESSVGPEKSQVDAYLGMIENRMESPNAAVSDWIKSKIGRYIRSDFATEQDQMVKAAEEGKKLHFTSPRALEESPPILDPSLTIMRKTEGFPPQGFAKTEQGKLVEDMVDSSVWPATLDNTPSDYIPSSIRNLKDTDPNMRIYEFPDAVFEDNMRITDLANKMDKMMTEKTVKLWNQEVPIPKEYQLDTDTLKGLTPAQASNRAAMKEEWLAKKEPELAGQALTKDPKLVSHTYDNGSKWISPADLSENDMHRQMVNSIGCRGGWCTDKDSFALDYGSGDNRLHILLDKGYQPRAQLTMSDRQGSLSEFLIAKSIEDPGYEPELYRNLQNARSSGNRMAVVDAMEEFARLPEYLDWSRKNNIKQITEIKGQFNKEDLTQQPYLKEVQDFVKRQGPDLQNVDNLDGIDMLDMRIELPSMKQYGKQSYSDVLLDKLLKVNGNSYYAGKDEFPTLIKRAYELPNNAARQIQMNFFGLPKEKAHGGMIERQPTDNRRYL
jgi:hypothetical protein